MEMIRITNILTTQTDNEILATLNELGVVGGIVREDSEEDMVTILVDTDEERRIVQANFTRLLVLA